LVIVAALGRVGPWLPAVGPDVQGVREKIIFSLLGWLLISMMILAIVTRDPAQQAFRWRPGRLVGFGLPHLQPRSFGEAKLAVLLRVAATMIGWTSLW